MVFRARTRSKKVICPMHLASMDSGHLPQLNLGLEITLQFSAIRAEIRFMAAKP